MKWWNWLLVFALFSLLFIAIPLSYTDDTDKEELKPMFDKYIATFNKTYKNKPDEYATRFEHFVKSVQEIERLNSLSQGPEHLRARYGLTPLSDMSQAEYKEIHLADERMRKPPQSYGKSWSNTKPDYYKYDVDNFHSNHQRNRSSDGGGSHNNIYSIIRKKRATLPLQMDWRTKGVIGTVRDQGLCGACWAFSTVGVMEAMSAIQTGKLETLSVQEAIDCAGLGNSGCAGGDICLLLEWLYLTGAAVEKESLYPIRLADGLCRANKTAVGVKVAKYTCDDFSMTEDKILEAVATHGPVSVAVNALTWQNYLGGVIQYHCSESPADLNHAVQLVGYDLTADVPYYIAKNSWGKEFGLGGYLQLAIGKNICGLANEVATVDVK